MTTIERGFHAYLDEMNVVTMIIPYEYDQGEKSSFRLQHDEYEIPLTIVEKIPHKNFMKYLCQLSVEIHPGDFYWVIDSLQRKTDLQIGAVIRTEKFDQIFYYEGKLGVQYQRNESIFKLWAPTATKVKLKLFTPDGSSFETIDMSRIEKGVWTTNIHSDLECYQYVYLVCVNRIWNEAVDPYVVSVTANGTKGVIIDLNKTKIPQSELPALKHVTDSIIYETHIRDFTIHRDSGVNHKGTYEGVSEWGTIDPNGNETCLSYVKSLGITHLEFLPLHDFAGVDELESNKEYNWGYNPLHFNVPEGSYSSDPTDPYKRINELKGLIDTIHQKGIKVVLDVVYNHVYERESSSFEKIVPGYYFRHDYHGIPSNGTGVGNDLASERNMVRKFIVDSVLFWVNEYQIDGFRFDLMGILDIKTMNEIRRKLEQIDPTILIIGEGWDLNTPLALEKKANIHNQQNLPRIGHFNDWFRDSIKGSTFNLYDKGYICGNENYYESAIEVMAGSIGYRNDKEGLFTEPIQSVNYVESHDNHTLWDKLAICLSDEDEEVLEKVHVLGTSIVLLSQGIPFLHSGQEFFRTKKGEGNSYRSSDEINQLDWNRRQKYNQNIQYVKGLINIRKSHSALRFPTAILIRKHMKSLPIRKPLIYWKLEDVGKYGPTDCIIILINPTKEAETVELPHGNWNILANGKQCFVDGTMTIVDQSILIEGISLYVLFKESEN
jgi:pullulanase